MLLDARSIGNHQSFEKVFSYSIFRGGGNIKWMNIARREQLKASLRVSDGGLQIVKKARLIRCRSFDAFNQFVRSEGANCS